MPAITNRFNYLFRSTKGLVLVAIAMISLVTAIWGTLSGPMVEWGVKDITVRLLGMRLVEAEREGRIIMLYHTIAMAVVAIEVYIITALVPMKGNERTRINGTITVGYITAMVFGLWFAYFGHDFVFHGLFLFGQSLVFFAGVMLAAALWPWKKEYRVQDPAYARGPGGIDLERAAFFTTAVATLGSTLFGAVPGSYFGNGFESFLAENVVREPHKSALQLAVIGHLHIMLTLIAVALALIVGRWLDFKGTLHQMAMPLLIAGTIVVTIGVWTVVPFEEIAHYIIYVGSVLVLLATLFLVIHGFRKLIHERLAEQGIQKASFWPGLSALLHDPLKFGALWQMVYMNFVVTFVGIFMAIRLDKVIRMWTAREERIVLTGHWHILSGIIATIILLYYADLIGLKGKARQWFGWLVILGSDLAFGAVTVFETKRLYVSESAQQPVVNWTMALADLGLAVVLVVLAVLMVWRLVDLFKPDGRWTKELAEAGPVAPVEEASP
ncbi:MAG: hypothetical protein AB1566_09725 [Chloroflexota bacterium]